MSSRIVLINPPVPDEKVWVREGRCQQWDIWGAPFPPLSLALISTQLVKAGFETRIIDSGPQKKCLETVLAECVAFAPMAAVIAAATPTIHTDLGWFLTELKKKVPGIKAAVIGIHVSALPEETLLRYPDADFAVMGEPEITSRELISSLAEGRTGLSEIKGIAYRDDGRIKINPPRCWIEDLDSLGLPDWGKISFKDYPLPITGRPFSLIVFSRGCPFECRFCATQAYNGQRVRRRSALSLLEEIRHNLSLGVSDFLFWTEQMTLDADSLNSFLDAVLAEGLNKKIKWVCNSRVDFADEALFGKMREAGCWQIAFGFEFGDDRILRLAGKGGRSSIARSRAAAEAAAKAGLVVDGHFIIGYPGEDAETMRATINLALSLPITFAHFYAAVPFPGAKLYEEAVHNGWIEPSRWDRLNQDMPAITTDRLNPHLAGRYIRRAYRKFYFRPATALRILRIPNGIKEFWKLFLIGIGFLRQVK
ncbi:MAG: radical SAM protein [bacterium]